MATSFASVHVFLIAERQLQEAEGTLVETLMGFQFNHVGGGTKTRRPVALHLLSATGDTDEHDEAGVAARPMPLADMRKCLWQPGGVMS